MDEQPCQPHLSLEDKRKAYQQMTREDCSRPRRPKSVVPSKSDLVGNGSFTLSLHKQIKLEQQVDPWLQFPHDIYLSHLPLAPPLTVLYDVLSHGYGDDGRAENAAQPAPPSLCKPLPASVEALDLSGVSPTQTLASLRFLVLSHLADLERHLSELESPDIEAWKLKGGIKIEEARTWAKTALEMLNGIRAEVRSHLPDVHFSDLASVESFLRAHIPDLPEMPTLGDVRSHLPEIPDVRSHLPELPYLLDMAEVRSHFPEMPQLPDMPDMMAHFPDFADVRSKLEDARTRFQEIDSQTFLDYVPTLSMRLQNLHSHLSSAEVEFTKMLGIPSLAPSSLLRDVLDALSADLVQELATITAETDEKADKLIEQAACEVARAVKHSFEGMRLITYHDLPDPWKNNPFVTQGYRFIPIERWPLLIKSVFMLHNETLNIHTHLIPLVLYLINIISIIRNPTHFDAAEVFFMSFACICLLGSAVWHTMAGCAHHGSMEFCARVDYVGIGWLISPPNGVFLALAFSGLAPLLGMAVLHSSKEASVFIAPLLPSFASYLIGLVFYAYHWPERHLPENVRLVLDRFGGGSHAIWHCFIVLAVSQHKQGMHAMKEGFQCLAEYASG
ncbi:hypothetical protein NP233_g226 [Leucocoprinus birnbaumii]|uniref:Uncharacterized protein n=1 Tax=Leucocoprinus birnbaumii TaxID=56174 RepID=A0AAD5W2T5_9AGAR|nr:hypothetical protein NP233_g226 [Leucocoprinus birnbaumii]